MTLTRTSCSMSESSLARSTSTNRFMSADTSSVERRQFSVENE